MAISKIQYKSSANATPVVWMDTTDKTVQADKLLTGYTALKNDGTTVTGTYEGGGVAAEEKDVNFIDYDGTILYSYTAQEAQALTALPANPTHTGLTSQGWNWTLAQIKSQLTNVGGKVWVGQMYVTTSGATEIDITLQEGRLSPVLYLGINGTVVIDWGDDTTPDTVIGNSTGNRYSPTHTYASPGDYTISISVSSSGSFIFFTSSSYTLLGKNSTLSENKVYSNCINAIRLGTGITNMYQYSFCYCSKMKSITIPSSVTTMHNNLFQYCYTLQFVTIPSGITEIGNYAFQYCSNLSKVAFPSSMTTFSPNMFYYCYALSSVTIPSGAALSNGSVFYNCLALDNIVIPNSVTSIANSVFRACNNLFNIVIPNSVESILGYAFYSCASFSSVTIPSSVTSIAASAFGACYGVKEYHFQRTTPPTIETSAFGIVSDCIIYVPYSADHSVLAAYQAADNWSDYASYMQEEPQS